MKKPADMRIGHKSSLLSLLLVDWLSSNMQRDAVGLVQNRLVTEDFKLTPAGRDVAMQILKERLAYLNI